MTLRNGLALLAATTLLGCSEKMTTPDPEPEPDPLATVRRGYGLSPVGFPVEFTALGAFYAAVAAEPSSEVLWVGSWRDDAVGGTDAGTVPAAALSVVGAAETHGFTTSVAFGWRTGATPLLAMPADATNDWTNESAKAAFTSMVTDFVTDHDPTFLFLGNEIDFYYEQDPVDYARWVAFLGELIDAIHAADPDTHVGTIFNFEHLSGGGALTGWTTPQWAALDAIDLDKLDVLGVTLYPFLGHAEPGDVPSDLLAPLVARIGDLPVVINETGWPAVNLGGLVTGWTCSEANQIAFANRLPGLLAGVNLRAVHWLFRNGAVDDGSSSDAWKVFGSVSTHDETGAARPVAAAWLALELDATP